MLLILLEWLLILVISTVSGIIVFRIFKINISKNSIYLIFTGWFLLLTIYWIKMFFAEKIINKISAGIFQFSYFDIVLYFIVAGLFIYYKNIIKKLLINFSQTLKSFTILQKILLFTGFFLMLILSAQAPHLPDNESYYIQTVKWADQYGFFKGLINIHPFLAQFSGWHILQSVFNFAPQHFNDLNGFLWLYFLWFGLTKKEKYWNYILLVLAFLWYFSSSPSPDLPVLFLSLIAIDLFLKNYHSANLQDLYVLLIIVLLAVLIKLTAAPLILLIIILSIRFRKQYKTFSYLSIFALPIAFSFIIIKNYLVSGFPFYPFHFLSDVITPDWQYPMTTASYITDLGRFDQPVIQFLQHNFSLNLKSLLSIGIWLFYFFSLFITGYIAKKSRDKALQILMGIQFIYALTVFIYMPHPRFILHFLIFNAIWLAGNIFSNKIAKMIYPTATLLMFGVFISVLFTYHKTEFDLLTPHKISALPYRFQTDSISGFKYNYPQANGIFWENGDAPLPAVSPAQIRFFKENFGIVPHKKSNDRYISITN